MIEIFNSQEYVNIRIYQPPPPKKKKKKTKAPYINSTWKDAITKNKSLMTQIKGAIKINNAL